ncbi:hypothetical protein LCM10_04420 [Rossellomorea aquimaris]|uniref:hypothetical protein n=1 Tax=Rossellomorea aquimaris TaxID=189382 RepID=UPI001CD20636|nr:hypothetical protein [Rossellomorea aquimaris]MCA1054222.1 hypothetical protein [Rossellomorea aquimaris]
MPQSLDAQTYIIPFFLLATFSLFHTKTADYKPHTRIKMYAITVFLYLGTIYIIGMAYIDSILFGKVTLATAAILVVFIFLVPNKWIDKNFDKWEKSKRRKR